MAYLLVEVFIKVLIQSFLAMNLEEDERFLYVWLPALFGDSRINGDAKISFKSCLISWIFFSVH